MLKHTEKDTSFAKLATGVRIHISDAASGRRGYYCLGCHNQMQAVRVKRRNYASYFRHDARDMLNKPKCTYSDVAERNKIAKEILVQLKRIKVPAVYKYPPRGHEGQHYKIVDSKCIEAFKVYTERYFYEDVNKNIQWGNKTESDQLTFLAKADIVFLNQSDQPILIIEFVERHAALKDDIKIRMKRLGIDAVQVRIPRESVLEISKVFDRTENTKWIYNYEQEQRQYVWVPDPHSEGIPIIDELQREFFEENFFCRQTEIRRLIRSINNHLESEQYRSLENRLSDEISRIDDSRANANQQFRELQERAKGDIRAEFGPRGEAIGAKEEQISGQEKRINRLYKALEARYKRKFTETDRKAGVLESEFKKESTTNEYRGSSIESRKRDIENQIRNIEREIKDEARSIEDLQRQTEALQNSFAEDQERIRIENERIEKDEFNKGIASIERIRNRDAQGNAELSRRFKEFSEIRRLIDDTIEKRGAFNRIRKAWDSLRSGTYKAWAKN